ncbi:MAG: lysylphosphatidylglycerol synthase transmembrane domain-containing protein [Candidatus Omnitrophota bacterium]
MTKKIVSICVRAIISLGLILILLYIMRGKYSQIWDAIRGANALYLGLGFVAFVVALTLAAIRLKLIIDAQGAGQATVPEAISLTFIGYFFNNFLPTSIGGDVAKAYYLSRKSSDKLGSFTSVVVDRAMGLITMILMAAIALLFAQGQVVDVNVRYMIYTITFLAILGTVFLMNKNFAKKFSILLIIIRPIEDKVRRLYNAVHLYKKHTSLIVKSFIISIFSQLFFFVSIGILAVSVGSIIPPMDILMRMPIICAMSLLPSINGLGVREGSTVVLFGPIIGKENAFVVSILWLLVLFLTSIIGGIIYAFSPQFKIKWGEVERKEAI